MDAGGNGTYDVYKDSGVDGGSDCGAILGFFFTAGEAVVFSLFVSGG